ncbi:hypothetical protein TanjilG_14607 [Lupinus angustifolius]|uniref:Uncharacterized protein n=1 Tax=Lupinus angustifolius TaxID=3871 RepID=A0A1J7G9P2_LUPAN|nr:hypothetical protein TanjilG_14607 [Lupinus angustifolius]
MRLVVDEGVEIKNGEEDLVVKVLELFARVLDATLTVGVHNVEAIAVNLDNE